MKITVRDAVKLLDVPEQFIKVGIQNNRLNIGECAKLGKEKYYVIVPEKLAKYMGISLKELERRVEKLQYDPRIEDGVSNWITRNSIISISTE